jgi:hypothetical protein
MPKMGIDRGGGKMEGVIVKCGSRSWARAVAACSGWMRRMRIQAICLSTSRFIEGEALAAASGTRSSVSEMEEKWRSADGAADSEALGQRSSARFGRVAGFQCF